MNTTEILPLPWYIAGPLIGITIPLLYYWVSKPLGISSSFNQFCSMTIDRKQKWVSMDLKKEKWRIFFIAGLILAGVIHQLTIGEYTLAISQGTIKRLQEMDLQQNEGFQPKEIWNSQALNSPIQWLYIALGGLLIGFGTRYAGGCTSGHTVMGISVLAPSSLLATVAFFSGGLIAAWFLIPLLIS